MSSLFFIACDRLFKEEAHKSVMARVPWPSADGSYHFQDVQITTLKSVSRLESDLVQFYQAPVPVEGGLSGDQPYVQYVEDSNGVIVPTDLQSLQLLTLYAHLEKLHDLDIELESGSYWPRSVGFQAAFKKEDQLIQDNAFYISTQNALLFVPLSQAHLPLTVNGGVIGHEHFHSIFYQRVLRGPLEEMLHHSFFQAHAIDLFEEIFDGLKIQLEKLKRVSAFDQESDDQKLRISYLRNLIRSFNEGMADVWGWVYSGQPDFISPSLPQIRDFRKLNAPPTKLLTTEEKQSEVSVSGDLTEDSYALGTQYSRLLKGYADIHAQVKSLDSVQSRKWIAKHLLLALDALKTEVVGLSATQILSTYSLLSHFLAALPEIAPEECRYFAQFTKTEEGFGWPSQCKESL